MQIKLKVIPDSGATEVYEFKDYGELLEHIVNLPMPEEDHEHKMEIEREGTIDEQGEVESQVTRSQIVCLCDKEDEVPVRKDSLFRKLFPR